MFDAGKKVKQEDLNNVAKLAEALIVLMSEVQIIAKEVQKMRVDVNKLIENNK